MASTSFTSRTRGARVTWITLDVVAVDQAQPLGCIARCPRQRGGHDVGARIAGVEGRRGLASRPACPTLPLTVARPEGATNPDDESERGDMTALRVCLPPVTPMEEQHG